MKKSTIKSPLKILAATSVTIFSLLSVFTSTAAWFDSQRNLKNGANQMAVESIQDFSRLDIYLPVNNGIAVAGGDVTYQFDSTAAASLTKDQLESGMSGSVYLGGGDGSHPFTTIEPHHPMLLVIQYETALTTAVRIKASTNERFICPVAGDDDRRISHEINGNETSPYPLSSVVHFSAKAYSTYANFQSDQISSWKYSRNTVWGNTWQQSSFASVGGGGLFEYSPDCQILSSLSGSVQTVAIMIEYNTEIISAISAYYLGERFISGQILPFSCDWTMEI